MIERLRGEVISRDSIVRILLNDVDALERVPSRIKLLDEPGAVVGPVAENLAKQAELLAAGLLIFQEPLAGKFRMRGERVIQKGAYASGKQTDEEKRRE